MTIQWLFICRTFPSNQNVSLRKKKYLQIGSYFKTLSSYGGHLRLLVNITSDIVQGIRQISYKIVQSFQRRPQVINIKLQFNLSSIYHETNFSRCGVKCVRGIYVASFYGLAIRQNFKLKNHVNNVCTEANETLGFLRRIINISSTSVRNQPLNL